jgi:hypothetical protein
MGRTIAISLLAATLYAAPVGAEPASPVAPSITKINNDATLRAPHVPRVGPSIHVPLPGRAMPARRPD